MYFLKGHSIVLSALCMYPALKWAQCDCRGWRGRSNLSTRSNRKVEVGWWGRERAGGQDKVTETEEKQSHSVPLLWHNSWPWGSSYVRPRCSPPPRAPWLPEWCWCSWPSGWGGRKPSAGCPALPEETSRTEIILMSFVLFCFQTAILESKTTEPRTRPGSCRRSHSSCLRHRRCWEMGCLLYDSHVLLQRGIKY